jgi:hypothetical protein
MGARETNVYGGFAAEHGLAAALEALRPLFGEGEVYIRHDPINGDSLIVSTGSAFFHTLYMDEEERYLFDGGVEGTPEQAISLTKSLSHALELAGIEHSWTVTVVIHQAAPALAGTRLWPCASGRSVPPRSAAAPG